MFIPFDDQLEHAHRLKEGLSKLPEEFLAQICPICDGRTEYRQTYAAGCGGGYFKSMGPCEHCGKTGLIMKSRFVAAPESVVHQVLNAANPNYN
jgi:hypothetical protein